MTDSSSPMNSPLTENSPPEKALWYQEVLALDPASRIFFPYARLLAETGRRAEAVEVLRSGLTRHPEFLDARLLLIDLLHASGQDAAAGLEASGIIESLSQCSALWEIWSRLPGVRADQAAMLLFFGATFRRGGPGLADVFAAGLKALQNDSAEDADRQNMTAAPACGSAAITPDQVSDGSSSGTISTTGKSFVMDEDAPWYSLDSVPDDDDVYDDDEEQASSSRSPLPPSATDLFFAGRQDLPREDHDEEEQTERIPAAHPVPRSSLEGKSSLCTRSMAHILEEQGATDEAADIYRELLEVSSSPEERAELNAKLDSLMQGTEQAVPGQPPASGIMDMLETLAVRLENKSRA